MAEIDVFALAGAVLMGLMLGWLVRGWFCGYPESFVLRAYREGFEEGASNLAGYPEIECCRWLEQQHAENRLF
mgnify:CR=1 FL=1